MRSTVGRHKQSSAQLTSHFLAQTSVNKRLFRPPTRRFHNTADTSNRGRSCSIDSGPLINRFHNTCLTQTSWERTVQGPTAAILEAPACRDCTFLGLTGASPKDRQPASCTNLEKRSRRLSIPRRVPELVSEDPTVFLRNSSPALRSLTVSACTPPPALSSGASVTTRREEWTQMERLLFVVKHVRVLLGRLWARN